MSLDLGETLLQMDQAAREWRPGYASRQERLARLLREAAAIPPELARERTRNFVDPFLAAEVQTDLLGASDAPPPPADWAAASVDGSHIDVDRHLPVACYLLNLGGCVLTYGRDANARFFSHPQLAYRPEELYLRDPEHPAAEEAVAGPLLGLRRTVRELEQLAAVVAEIPPDLPTLALVDGTLVLWGLGGQGYPPFVRAALVEEGLLPALESLRELAAAGRPVTLAAYVSLPRVTEVVNAIRRCLCPEELSHCRESCGHRVARYSPCSAANDFLDRDIFAATLTPYQRSPIYRTNSSVPREHYGRAQQVCFYYLHAGAEIARVEAPQWVADSAELLDLGHSLLAEQCRRGQGYPAAIAEAHEQAVVNGRDRQLFRQLIAETLEQQGLPSYTSQKERSKRRPWL